MNTPPLHDHITPMVKKIIADAGEFLPSMINESDNLNKDLDFDSLDVAGIICEIEKQYNIEIPDLIAEQAETVGDLIKITQNAWDQKCANQQPAQ